MKVHYFFREYHAHQTSIEKLFNIIIPQIRKGGIETENIINPHPFSLKGIFGALQFFKNNQGDVNHITGDIHWSILGLDPEKTLLTIHDLVGMRDLTGIKKKIYYYLWVLLPIRKAKYITVISEKTKNEIVELLPQYEKKIRVIPNPLTSEIAPLTLDKKNNIPHVLVVGTRKSNKNVDRILAALKDLEVFLTIVGDLEETQIEFLDSNDFKYQIKTNISDHELNDCYDAADILCFPSLYEGFGLPILEAQARNCAVVTSEISPMKEVAGNAALLVDPESVTAIKNAVESIINNKDLREQLIIAGRENIKTYSVENIANMYTDLYHKISKK